MNTKKTIKMTKQLVDEFLAANTHNRTPSKNRVDALARSMKDGTFMSDNGQTIVINQSKTWLLDGQHRLLAIKQAEYPVFAFDVVFIPDEDAQKYFNTIDIVKGARTAAQVLALEGLIPNAHAVASLCSSFSLFATGKTNVNPAEITSWYTRNKNLIELLHITRTASIGKFRPTSFVLAAVLNAYAISNDEEVFSSFDRVMAGEPTTESEKTLVRFLCENAIHKQRPGDQFYKTTKALLNPSLKILTNKESEDHEPLRAGKVLKYKHPLFV